MIASGPIFTPGRRLAVSLIVFMALVVGTIVVLFLISRPLGAVKHLSLKAAESHGFSHLPGGGLEAAREAWLDFDLKTEVAFTKGWVQLTTGPNARYRLTIVKADGESELVAEDSFFERFFIDLSAQVNNQRSLVLRIEAEPGRDPARISGAEIQLEYYPQKLFSYHLTVTVLATCLIILVGLFVHGGVLAFAALNVIIGGLLALFAVSAWPYFYLVNLAGCLAWATAGLAALARTAWPEGLFKKRAWRGSIEFLRSAGGADGVGRFLAVSSAAYLAVSALLFRWLDLNQTAAWTDGSAGVVLKIALGACLAVCLAVLAPLRRTAGDGGWAWRWDRTAVERLAVWAPVGLAVWLLFYAGMARVIDNFGRVAPDANSYFVNIDNPWSAFLQPTAYRAPLLSYLNKAVYSLYDLPHQIAFMTQTSLLFCFLGGAAVVWVLERLFANRWLVVAGSVLMLACLGFVSPLNNLGPIRYLSQGIRLYPFIFLLTLVFYHCLAVGGASRPHRALAAGVGLGLSLGLAYLLRPESLLFLAVIPACLAIWPKRWRSWLAALAAAAVLIAPYAYLKSNQPPSRSNVELTAKAWRNLEFQNRPGLPTTPEVRRRLYTGPPVSWSEYFFGMHTFRQVAAYTAGGYYRSLITGPYSYLVLDTFAKNQWGGRKWPLARKAFMAVALLTLIGLMAALEAKGVVLALFLSLLALAPNAFMNYLGSSPRHFYHVWPFMLVITIHGLAVVGRSAVGLPLKLLRGRYLVLYLAVAAVMLAPGMFPHLHRLDHLDIFKNRPQNHVRGSVFQKWYPLEYDHSSGWGRAVVKEALFPQGEGMIGFSFKRPGRGEVRLSYHGVTRRVVVGPDTGEVYYPFHTPKVGRFEVVVECDDRTGKACPKFIKISSRPVDSPPGINPRPQP